MTPAEMRCVVGIDVAKQAHVGCALEAPSGALRHTAKPDRGDAGGVRAVAVVAGDLARRRPAGSGPDGTRGDRGPVGAAL